MFLTIDELAAHPDWSRSSGDVGILVFSPNPDFTLAREEEHTGPFSLTNGDGTVFIQGTVGELAAYADARCRKPSQN